MMLRLLKMGKVTIQEILIYNIIRLVILLLIHQLQVFKFSASIQIHPMVLNQVYKLEDMDLVRMQVMFKIPQ